MLYTKPMLILFGGESPTAGPLSSKVWMLDLTERQGDPYEWMVLEADHLPGNSGSLWPVMCIVDPVPSDQDNDIMVLGGINPFEEDETGQTGNTVLQILNQKSP